MSAGAPRDAFDGAAGDVLQRLHHVTSVVPSLEAAIAPFAALCAPDAWLRETLPGRGVDTARARIGGTWLVFVMPTGPGAPAARLAAHGPGPMLLSFGVASLEAAVARLARSGIRTSGSARVGVGGWRVQDLELTLPGGVLVQLCEETAALQA